MISSSSPAVDGVGERAAEQRAGDQRAELRQARAARRRATNRSGRYTWTATATTVSWLPMNDTS